MHTQQTLSLCAVCLLCGSFMKVVIDPLHFPYMDAGERKEPKVFFTCQNRRSS